MIYYILLLSFNIKKAEMTSLLKRNEGKVEPVSSENFLSYWLK